MKYTFAQFKAEYPDDDACLEAVFQNRFGDLTVCPKCGVEGTRFYRVKKRPCYACMHCGHQLHPLAQTIFRKSRTSLWSWFYAIYLFSNSKNGVAAAELQRHLGVTYKTAWRMARQIRLLMADEGEPLVGVVEVDETYVGGRWRRRPGANSKAVVFGMVERGGRVKAQHVRSSGARVLLPRLRSGIVLGTRVCSDQWGAYRKLNSMGYIHETVNHGVYEWARGEAHTNTIEGFWSQMKRSINGTYHRVSPKYLQSYVDEFAFRYNLRDAAVYPVLVERVGRRV